MFLSIFQTLNRYKEIKFACFHTSLQCMSALLR